MSPLVSRQMPCPVCAPHEHHLLTCEQCDCSNPPLPGITLESE